MLEETLDDPITGRSIMNADNEQRLFGPVEHRLFRYTAVLMSSVVLIGLVGWLTDKTR